MENKMKYYLAPMEGITGYIYRNAYNDIFGDIDVFYTPFISTNYNRKMISKEINDILPEHNKNVKVIPQILSNNSGDFVATARQIKEFGYKEVNLNLGCPSGTVVSKKRGAGFLSDLRLLDIFLDEVFENLDMDLSVKTRIGISDTEEFDEILKLYNKYPIKELIVHPRVREEYYNGKPHKEAFKTAVENSNAPVVYNGNIFNKKDKEELTEEFPDLEAVMLGRGLIGNPGLVGKIEKGISVEKGAVKEFHDKIYSDYKEIMSGDKNALFKMKEIWFYMHHIFAGCDKYYKKIRKTQSCGEYEVAAAAIFRELEINDEKGFEFKK